MSENLIIRSWRYLWSHLHFKIAVGTTVATTVILFTSLSFFWLSARQERTDEFYDSAKVKVDIIFLSLQTAMLYKTPATGRAIVEQMVERFSTSGEFSQISIIDKEGIVWVSSDFSIEGKKFPETDETCLPCHQEEKRKTLYASWLTNQDGDQTYRISSAFMNEASCIQCHASQSAINGILVADFPMSHFQAALSKELHVLVSVHLLSLVTMLLSLRYLLRRVVVTRIRSLSEKTQMIGKGVIPTPMIINGSDEISNIERDFNEMGQGLIQQKKKNEELYRELIHQEKLAVVGQLVAGIAHDFNTPLGIILSRLECIRLDTENVKISKEFNKDFIVIERQIKRLMRTVQGLLVFAHQNPAQFMLVDVNHIVHEAIDACLQTIEKRGITVQCDLEQHIYPILGISVQLEQMLINLLRNSCDAVSEGGKIKISTQCTDSNAGRGSIIRVEDDGPGFPEDMIQRVFMPFVTTKPATEGTGLGLAIVAQVVAQHRGNISASRSSLGGALIEIFLPASELSKSSLPYEAVEVSQSEG